MLITSGCFYTPAAFTQNIIVILCFAFFPQTHPLPLIVNVLSEIARENGTVFSML